MFLKPKCYEEFDPKKYGKSGKTYCLGKTIYVPNNKGIFGIAEKCKKCKYHCT